MALHGRFLDSGFINLYINTGFQHYFDIISIGHTLGTYLLISRVEFVFQALYKTNYFFPHLKRTK